LIIETPSSSAESVGKMVKDIMENVYTKLPVKLKADVSVGINWGEL
jgi:DNA polymerase I-like protein with 3'-5' exonuclease and polymerase domains